MRVKSVSGRVKTPKMKLTAAQKKTRLINLLFTHKIESKCKI